VVDADVAPTGDEKAGSFIASLKPGVSAVRALSSSSQVLKAPGICSATIGL